MTASHDNETGTTDFYSCERVIAGCADMEGCPDDGACVTGHGRKLAIDDWRTLQMPTNAGSEPSCPYTDEE
jgi:hypothetical protein